jgi:type IV pilus assembly protein PilB
MVALAGWWACALAWMRSVDWVGRDATRLKLAPAFWSTVTSLPFVVTALVVWWIPSTIACFVLLALAWLVPLGIYVRERNRQLPESQRVATPGHARRIVAGLLEPFGVEIATGGAEDEDSLLPQVEFQAAGGTDPAEDAARQEKAAALPGWVAAVRLVQEAVQARADAIVVEPAAEGMVVRHQVDGVWQRKRARVPPKGRKDRERWQDVAASSREEGLGIMQAFQALCGLSGNKPQAGRFAVRVDGKPRQCRMTLQAASAGPRLVVSLEPPAAAFKVLGDLGMPEPIAEAVGTMLALEKGLLLIAGPAGSGLTTTFDLVVQSADRLMRDFVSLEDAAAPPRQIQNVRPVRFDARTGTTPSAALAAALREYPNVIITRDIRDKALLGELVKLAADGQFVIVSLAAADACEAVARVVAAGVPKDLLARTCVGVLAQRLVRRVCPKCREDHPPPPELLRRLGQTAEQVPTIHRAAAEGCRLCQGTGYLGRTAVFELASGPALRQAIAAGEPPPALRAAAVKGGMRPLAAAGLAIVATGVTSLEEAQRALAPPAAAAKPRTEARK